MLMTEREAVVYDEIDDGNDDDDYMYMRILKIDFQIVNFMLIDDFSIFLDVFMYDLIETRLNGM